MYNINPFNNFAFASKQLLDAIDLIFFGYFLDFYAYSGGRTFYSTAFLLLDKKSGACDTTGDLTAFYISKYMR